MQKGVYCVTKLSRGGENAKMKGVGYISEGDLLIPQISKKGKAYIRVFADACKHCHQSIEVDDEYHGTYYEIIQIEGRDIEMTYNIWFKHVN